MTNLQVFSMYDLVYTFRGGVSHIKLYNYEYSACNRAEFWLGTGSQAEYDKAVLLPLCKRCAQWLNDEETGLHRFEYLWQKGANKQ